MCRQKRADLVECIRCMCTLALTQIVELFKGFSVSKSAKGILFHNTPLGDRGKRCHTLSHMALCTQFSTNMSGIQSSPPFADIWIRQWIILTWERCKIYLTTTFKLSNGKKISTITYQWHHIEVFAPCEVTWFQFCKPYNWPLYFFYPNHRLYCKSSIQKQHIWRKEHLITS